MKPAAELRYKIRFEQRALDGDNNRLGAWTEICTRSADLLPLKGGEAVQSQRLEGRQPVILIVRKDSSTALIDNSFRAVNARDEAVVWDITSKIFNFKKQTFEILAVEKMGGDDG